MRWFNFSLANCLISPLKTKKMYLLLFYCAVWSHQNFDVDPIVWLKSHFSVQLLMKASLNVGCTKQWLCLGFTQNVQAASLGFLIHCMMAERLTCVTTFDINDIHQKHTAVNSQYTRFFVATLWLNHSLQRARWPTALVYVHLIISPTTLWSLRLTWWHFNQRD